MGLRRYRIQNEKWDYFKDLYFPLESFKLHNQLIGEIIDNEISQAKAKYDQYLKDSEEDPNWEGEWFEYFQEHETKLQLSNIHYDSQINSIYSFLEKKMAALAKYLSKQNAIAIDPKLGKGIFKYRKYLTGVCKIDFAPVEKQWFILTNYNLLRNHLTHSEGMRNIEKNETDLIKFLGKMTGVELSEDDGTIKFDFTSDEIIKELIDTVSILLNYIYKE